jgi:hypothetical protein
MGGKTLGGSAPHAKGFCPGKNLNSFNAIRKTRDYGLK